MSRRRLMTVVMAVVCLYVAGQTAWAANPIDATITVTPVPTVDLTLDVTTYAFGNLNVNSSSYSATALNLDNSGNVDVTVDKKIQTEPAGWNAGSIAARNVYVLYCATAASRIDIADFTNNTKFLASSSENDLTNAAGADTVITTDAGSLGDVNLWFRLDMPTEVGNQDARTITVRFTASAQ